MLFWFPTLLRGSLTICDLLLEIILQKHREETKMKQTVTELKFSNHVLPLKTQQALFHSRHFDFSKLEQTTWHLWHLCLCTNVQM